MGDVGVKFLEVLREKMMIDDEWTQQHERGFTWWAYRLAQHFEVDPPVSDGVIDIYAVRIWTDIVRNVDPATNPDQIVTVANMHQSINATVWDPETQTVSECCTTYVNEENFDWMANLIAAAAVIQNSAAHTRAHALADICAGVPAASDHPVRGHRPEMDDILNVPQQVLVPVGAEPSHFAGPKMAAVLDFMTHMGIAGSSGPTEVRFSVPFADHHTSLAMLAAGQGPPMSHGQILTDAPHPEDGNGALTLMWIPAHPDFKNPAMLANALNHAEAQCESGVPLLGAWCPDPTSEDGSGLAFCSFLPNLVARPGLIENQVLYQRRRSAFAAHWLCRSAGSDADQDQARQAENETN